MRLQELLLDWARACGGAFLLGFSLCLTLLPIDLVQLVPYQPEYCFLPHPQEYATGLTLVRTLALLAIASMVMYAVRQRLAGRPVVLREAIRSTDRIGVLVIANLAVVIAVAVGLLGLIVKGLWIATNLSLTAPVVIFEKLSVRDSLVRSWELTKPHRWTIFWLMLPLWLAPIIFVVLETFWPLGWSHLPLYLAADLSWLALCVMTTVIYSHLTRGAEPACEDAPVGLTPS